MGKIYMADAYNKLCRTLLDYMQGEELLDYKQASLIMQYCTQEEEKIKYKKVDAIINKIYKKNKNKNVRIPSYRDLAEREGTRLRFGHLGYSTEKEITEILKERVDTYAFGAHPMEIEQFLKKLIQDVKIRNDRQKGKNETEKKNEEIDIKEETRYESKSKSSGTPYESIKKENKIREEIEEKKSNESESVEETLTREEKMYDKAIRNESMSEFDLGESYTQEERDRKNFLKSFLGIEVSLKRLSKEDIEWSTSYMCFNAKELENLIVTFLEESNFGEHSKLYDYTLCKPKYQPDKLLKQYEKLYNKYLAQFGKLDEDKKEKIKSICEINGNMEFIPSIDDIKAKVNERIEKLMIDREVGISEDDRRKVSGPGSRLTMYMKENQIANIYYKIKEKREKIDEIRPVFDFEVEQEWQKTMRLHESGVSKSSIRTRLEEDRDKQHEATKDKRKARYQNLQYAYAEAILVADKSDRTLSQICREVLREEPKFQEKESVSLVKREETGKLTFAKIKEAIARKLGKKKSKEVVKEEHNYEDR